nr:hypothetical protein [Aeromonas encheleia]
MRIATRKTAGRDKQTYQHKRSKLGIRLIGGSGLDEGLQLLAVGAMWLMMGESSSVMSYMLGFETKPNIHILNIIRPVYAHEALALDVPFAF